MTLEKMDTSFLNNSATTSLTTDALFEAVLVIRSSGDPNPTVGDSISDAVQALGRVQRRNVITAVLSIALDLTVTNYLLQLPHPVTPIQLIVSIQGRSESITFVGSYTKPAIVDLWASWCENRKLLAPNSLQGGK
jgi:thiol-disulfide isomerase/thioredoxin